MIPVVSQEGNTFARAGGASQMPAQREGRGTRASWEHPRLPTPPDPALGTTVSAEKEIQAFPYLCPCN